MRLRNLVALAAMAIGALVSGSAHAAPVTWNIVSSASSIALSLPTTTISTAGLTVSVRPRNQGTSGSGGTWNVGNVANIQGTFDTDTDFTSSIEFLTGTGISAVEAYNAIPLTGGLAGSAPAAFGVRIDARFALGSGNIMAAIRNVVLDASSAPLAITAGSYAANAVDFGIQTATLDYRAQDPGGLLGGTLVNAIGSGASTIDDLVSPNAGAGAGSIVFDPFTGPLGTYILTIPVSVPVSIDLEGVILAGSATGQVVATYQVVPEPATFAMLGLGLTMLAPAAVRRLRKKA